tara:strand:- start:7598 stop:7840 length:243 start_codon:yes stop_codon:yes gene_type:complete
MGIIVFCLVIFGIKIVAELIECYNKKEKQIIMSINELPNVKNHWVEDGYLTIKLETEDYIRLNFNDVEALKNKFEQINKL